MSCRSGCKTQDHSSYAECLQSANVTIGATINSPLQGMWESTKRDLAAYRNARAHGIQPESTSYDKIKQAENATRMLGRPYNSEKDPPANMIVNKNTVRFANTE